jgi:protein gp37
MGDLFHHDVPEDLIDCVFARMVLSPKHTFIVLTKRPGRALAYFERIGEGHSSGTKFTFGASSEDYLLSNEDEERLREPLSWPLKNLWIGVTAENQQRANERIPILLEIPAAIRFVSVEPMLGPIELGDWGLDWLICGGETGPHARELSPIWAIDLSEQCHEAGIPFFFKQIGGKSPAYEVDFRQWMRREFPRESH